MVLNYDDIAGRLAQVHKEMTLQGDSVKASYPSEGLSFEEEMEQIREFIEEAGEYGIAYECLVANLESAPFVITAKSTLALLEVALLFGFKTDRDEDAKFDRRAS